MHTYTVLKRFGNAHDSYVGVVEAERAKEAFSQAVKRYFQE